MRAILIFGFIFLLSSYGHSTEVILRRCKLASINTNNFEIIGSKDSKVYLSGVSIDVLPGLLTLSPENLRGYYDSGKILPITLEKIKANAGNVDFGGGFCP